MIRHNNTCWHQHTDTCWQQHLLTPAGTVPARTASRTTAETTGTSTAATNANDHDDPSFPRLLQVRNELGHGRALHRIQRGSQVLVFIPIAGIISVAYVAFGCVLARILHPTVHVRDSIGSLELLSRPVHRANVFALEVPIIWLQDIPDYSRS